MEPRLDLGKKCARQVLNELNVSDPSDLQDLEKLCLRRGVFVTYEDFRGLEGVLIRGRRQIAVRRTIAELGRKRFTIAHELGHWELHPTLDQLTMCTAADIYAYRGSAVEIEANTFAAEFLMPDFMLREELKLVSPTIATVKKLADRFQTSLTATAVRLCEFTDMTIFVAFSANDRLRWYRRSSRAKEYFFKKIGSSLDGDSLAKYCTDDVDDATGPTQIETAAWFPDDFNKHRFKVLEESVELGAYCVTMSIITVDD